ncbi:MAG: hypothetical protein ACXVI1_10725 [Halobacteriota archaeon]
MALNAIKKKIFLPELQLTRIVNADHPHAVEIRHSEVNTYYVAPVTFDDPEGYQILPKWTQFEFSPFPVPIGVNSAPWIPGLLYILARIEESPYPDMATYSNLADDLGAFAHFLAEYDLDWTEFAKNKLFRPTYRFRGFLIRLNAEQKISRGLAARRISTVVGMYRFLQREGILVPAFAPWNDRDRMIPTENSYGKPRLIKVTSTDLSISQARSEDDDFIYDEEKMCPLERPQQYLLCDALNVCGNTCATLMHLSTTFTGARLQTLSTMRLRHVRADIKPDSNGNLRIAAGPGTGIDTKKNVKGQLHFPQWLIAALRVYAESPLAQARRALSQLGDHPDQFLFLTREGNPFYNTKKLGSIEATVRKKRYLNRGGGLHQYIREYVIPAAHAIAGNKSFTYKFHWLRATFAMNLLEAQMDKVNKGEISMNDALEYVRERMWHKNITVTMRYLNYAKKKQKRREVQRAFEEHMVDLASRAMKGFQK